MEGICSGDEKTIFNKYPQWMDINMLPIIGSEKKFGVLHSEMHEAIETIQITSVININLCL